MEARSDSLPEGVTPWLPDNSSSSPLPFHPWRLALTHSLRSHSLTPWAVDVNINHTKKKKKHKKNDKKKKEKKSVLWIDLVTVTALKGLTPWELTPWRNSLPEGPLVSAGSNRLKLTHYLEGLLLHFHSIHGGSLWLTPWGVTPWLPELLMLISIIQKKRKNTKKMTKRKKKKKVCCGLI